MIDYKTIFETLEETLFAEGSKVLPLELVRNRFNVFKQIEGRSFSDSDYYQTLVDVIFYSGFKAATVNAKLDIIHKYFNDFDAVADYGQKEFENILTDKGMIRNRNKIKACIENAKSFKTIIQRYGSLQKYIEGFNGKESSDGLLLLKEELESKFSGLGKITVYHFLTDIGFPVLKPDRVICRIFERLGLIANREQIHQAIIQGKKFSEATKQPIRYIDIIFVIYGQMQSREFGIESGICLEKKPLCDLCNIHNHCNYYKNKSIS